MSADAQALEIGEVWDRVPHDHALATQLTVHTSDSEVRRFSLGAHAPSLSPQDIEQIHLLWVEAVKEVGPDVHHRDVVAAALGSLRDELAGERHDHAVARLRQQVQ